MALRSLILTLLLIASPAFAQVGAVKVNPNTNVLVSPTASQFRSANGIGTGDGDALTANPLSQFAATTSAQLAGVLTNETGTGNFVLSISPTFTGTANFANILVTTNFDVAGITTLDNGAIASDSTGGLSLGSGTITIGAATGSKAWLDTNGSASFAEGGATIDAAGNIAATALSGDGAALTALTAANITASTTVGRAILNATNPSAVRWIRINADNSITLRSASETLSDIGAAGLTSNTFSATQTIGSGGSLILSGGSTSGQGNIQLGANASGSYDSNVIYLDSTAKTMGLLAGSNPVFGGSAGPSIALRGNTYSAVASQRGVIFLEGGQPSSPTGIEGSVFIGTNGTQRMAILSGGLITLGGQTTSFPALKRNGATIETRLGDDSGFAATQSLYDRFGSGSPESAVTAPVGATYHRTDGGAGTTLYVKESGSGNTGWVAK